MNEEQIKQLVQERDALKAEHAFAVKAMTTLQAERDLAQADALEQARLCGMGGEREADLLGKVARLERERDALSKLADKWNFECDEMREDNKRLAAEVKTLRDGLRVYQTQLEKDTNESDLHALMRQGVEIAELKAENKTLRDALEGVHNWSPDGSNAKNLARAAIKWSDYEPN